MTKLLQEALEAVRQASPTEQDDIARAMLSMVGIGDLDDVDPDHWQDVLTAQAAARQGEIASPEDVETAFRAFDP